MKMTPKPNFTPRAQQAINEAKKVAAIFNNDYVTLEHLFYGMVNLSAGILSEILFLLQIDPDMLKQQIELSFFKFPEDEQPEELVQPEYDEHFHLVLKVSASISEKLGHEYVGIEHILLALLKYEQSEIPNFFKDFNATEEDIIAEVREYLHLSKEHKPPKSGRVKLIKKNLSKPAEAKLQNLEKFATNLNELAKQGKFDNIIGKEQEIYDASEILCRRTKNNPVLLGEPGVGKTAIVEGLTQKIVTGTCSDFLLTKIIYSLDLGSLIAGTKYRGQFEEKLKGIIEEVKKNQDIILFIDEIHTLVGAGSAEGSMDAANLLKPLLARGEIKCIGATTQNEYKKSILKDGALDRRFQAIKVSEPNTEETLQIMNGLKSKYESFHSVHYPEEVIELIVKLANKYVLDKQFPDKAIDIMDQAGSKVKIKNIERPQLAKDIEKELETLALEESKLQSSGHSYLELEDRQLDLLEEYDQVISEWSAKIMKNKILVKPNDIYEVLSARTGIPVNEISKKDSEKVLGLFKNLSKRIIGQETAIKEISESILRSKSGLQDSGKPVGSFLLVGTSGTGKTHTAKCIAEFVYGSKNSLIQIDMSEFSEKISSSRLTGASPGYVGYEEGGELTEKIRRNPYSVILFDEIEKAHPEVLNILLQILEEGFLTDNSGRKVYFNNAIIILTGNIGGEKAAKPNIGFGGAESTDNIAKDKLKTELKAFFKPEFLNRLNEIVLFNDFELDELIKISKLEMDNLGKKLQEKNIELSFTRGVLKYISEKAIQEKMGARPIKRIIQKLIENELSRLILSKTLPDGGSIKFSLRKNELDYKITEE